MDFNRKKWLTVFKKFLPKDEIPFNCQGIHYCKETQLVVAADGQKLITSKLLWENELEGLTIQPDTMEVLRRDYPKWQTIVPVKEYYNEYLVSIPLLPAREKEFNFGLITQEVGGKQMEVKKFVKEINLDTINDALPAENQLVPSVWLRGKHLMALPFPTLKCRVRSADAVVHFFDEDDDSFNIYIMPMKITKGKK